VRQSVHPKLLRGADVPELVYHVSWHRPGAQWVVRVGNEPYGAYLTKELALLDATEVVSEAQENGHSAHVVID
jgi:hypothetical protein